MTERQRQILKALIESFILSGEDVSSFELLRNHEFDVSSATLRNEFLSLTESGYLTKSHFASGRIPTIKGLYFYINNLMNEEQVNFLEIVRIGQELYNERFDIQTLLRQSMKTVHKLTGEPVFVIYNNVIQFYRISRLLSSYTHFPKKIQADYLKGLIKFWDVIEDPEVFSSILGSQVEYPRGGVGLFSGTELGLEELENFIAVFAPFKLLQNDTAHGYIGTIGYINLNYKSAVPALKTMADMLNNMLKGW
ncbi:MAG: hypothetical protein QY314_00165 [Candidatus Dojkabacteria bacterium]|nr:MAG: hypothetical protein QY314_00165 [Candidatus Dojkabacteria bacterium]